MALPQNVLDRIYGIFRDPGASTVAVAVVNPDGTSIAGGGGGGSGYAEDATPSPASGNLVAFLSALGVVRLVDPSEGLPVNVVAGAAGGGDAQLKIRNAGDTAWISIANVASETASLVWLPTKSVDGAHATIGVTTDADTASTLVGLLKWLKNRWPTALVGGRLDVNIGASASLTVTGPLTDAQLRATPVPVSGTFWQATQPVSGTFWQATQPVSIAGNQAINFVQIGGNAVSTGNGVVGTGVQRVAIASDNTAFTVNIGTFPDNEPFNLNQIAGNAISTGVGASGSGVQRVILADPSASASGWDAVKNIDVDETEDTVKASAGQVHAIYFANLHATAWRYLKLYNATTANVTVGTTVPDHTYPLPPSSAGWLPLIAGTPFTTAITQAATTGIADNDTGAPGPNEVATMIFYK